MQKQNLKPLSLAALLASSAIAATPALAQNPFPSHDSSVTLFSLDGPAEPVYYEPPRERADPYERTITQVVEDTTKTEVVEAVPAIDTGMWGAVWSGRTNLGATR